MWIQSITHRMKYNRYDIVRRLYSSTINMSQPTVLIYGGNGALGQSLVNAYNTITQYNTISVDYTSNNQATMNVLLNNKLHWKTQGTELLDKLADHNVKLQSVICVAGMLSV